MSLPLERASRVAQLLLERMEPFCEKIEVAGSIRRGRPFCGDIDLVILPKNKEDLKARCASKWRPLVQGPQNCIYMMWLSDHTEVQVDIFFAKPAVRDLLHEYPSNFGSLLLCRTGSKEHNIFLVEHAKRLGLKWSPYAGVFNEAGDLLASETEEQIFQALQLDFIPPQLRER